MTTSCSKCGAPIDAGSSGCARCGAPIEIQEQPPRDVPWERIPWERSVPRAAGFVLGLLLAVFANTAGLNAGAAEVAKFTNGVKLGVFGYFVGWAVAKLIVAVIRSFRRG